MGKQLKDDIEAASVVFLAGCDALDRCSDGSRTCVAELSPIVAELEARGRVAIEWEGPGRTDASEYYGYYWFLDADGGGLRYFFLPGLAGDDLIQCGSYCGWHVVEEPAGAILRSGPELNLVIYITTDGQRIEDLGSCTSPFE